MLVKVLTLSKETSSTYYLKFNFESFALIGLVSDAVSHDAVLVWNYWHKLVIGKTHVLLPKFEPPSRSSD